MYLRNFKTSGLYFDSCKLEKLFAKTHQQLPCSLKIVVNEINMYQITFLTTVLFLVKAVIDI